MDATPDTACPDPGSIAANFKILLKLLLEQPWKAQLVQFYMHKFWFKRIKPTLDKEWVVMYAAAVAADQKEPQVMVNNHIEVAQRLLEMDSEEFNKGIQVDIDEEHA
ncbi:uncharacterized protein STEHIDRAFT_112018 [Stereum hirsutum FP-91666 SS1]|uniref:uncharacterized protein n=1 Tax=Stereum hirsutum (strain FP-91666) TaxID=721885 RepID=UPI000444A78F|nr:uncharacterized protein STEHIDRAFT_112018 [Stereum hirsutum FP-91666 SS1]EIM85444.1 hypothetical protein STEHIDRAFT_112018 [Stereum hirsutum FP-91666 SS1]